MNEMNAGYARKQISTSRILAVITPLIGMASLVTMDVAVADPAPATVTSVSASTASPAPATPVASSTATTSGDGVLLADNQIFGNAVPNDLGPAPSPATTTGGSPLVGSGSVPPVVPQGYSDSKLPLTFSLKFNNIYDDNIYIRDIHRVGDFYWTMIPGIEYKSRELDPDFDSLDAQPENYFHFSYKPEFAEFLDETQNNYIDHHAEANYLFTGARLTLGLDAAFDTSHYPNIDFGGRLKATYYSSRIFWEYALTNRLTLGGNVAAVISRYDAGIDTDDINTTAYIDYDWFPKLKVGLGTTLGHVEVDDNVPDQNYEQFYARSTYQIREKISLTGQVGAEFRQYDNGASTTNPSFSLGLLYQPFDSTTIQLQGRRRSVPSISLANTNYNDTDVALILRQRVLQKFYLGLKTSYEHDDYFSVSSGAGTGLTYDFVTVRPSIEWDWNDYLKFTAYYEYQNNDSSVPINGFYDNSVGIGATFSY